MEKKHEELEVGDVICFPAFPESGSRIFRDPQEWTIRSFNDDGTINMVEIGGVCIKKLDKYEVKVQLGLWNDTE